MEKYKLNLFQNKSNSEKQKKERDFLTATFLLVIFWALLAIFLGIATDLPTYLFGKSFDEEGDLIKDYSIYGDYAKFVGAFLGGTLVIIGLWINNLRVKEQTKQNVIAEKAQLNTRFKDAALLLANDNTSANLSGIYALHQIAIEASKEENQNGLVKIIHEIFCTFLRENSIIERDNDDNIIKTEFNKNLILQEIIVQLLFLDPLNIYKNLDTYLMDVAFEYCSFLEGNLHNINFFGCHFYNCHFSSTSLSNVYFSRCEFENSTSFEGCLFYNFRFKETLFSDKMDFTGTIFEGMSNEDILSKAEKMTKEIAD